MPNDLLRFLWRPDPHLIAADWESFASDLRNTREPLRRSIKEVMIPSLQQNFASHGRPAWQPLAAFTVAKKGHTLILAETGTLIGQSKLMKSWTLKRETATLDNIVDYGVFQDYGFFNVRHRVHVPARRWAMFQEQDAEAIMGKFLDWLDELFEENTNV